MEEVKLKKARNGFFFRASRGCVTLPRPSFGPAKALWTSPLRTVR